MSGCFITTTKSKPEDKLVPGVRYTRDKVTVCPLCPLSILWKNLKVWVEKPLNVGNRLMGFSNGNLEDKKTERNAAVDA